MEVGAKKRKKPARKKEQPPTEEKEMPTDSEEILEPFDDEASSTPNTGPIIVGIGASAGGLEALRAMLSHLPTESNIAYVIAQHLDPTHKSMLTSLLARYTTLEVISIKNHQLVEAHKIYITPPGKDVIIKGGYLYLSQPTAAIGPKPSIDQFLTSLAEDKRGKAIGIILSGTGSDGAFGIRAIKAEGGIAIVQEERTARYNGMPRAALDTGLIDLVLPPERIGPELIEILKHPQVVPVVASETEPLDHLQIIFNLLLDKTGCDFSDYKLSTIHRRLERRMSVHKLGRLEDYVRYLQNSATEVEQLFKDILISVTSFFRDPQAFESLQQIISNIIKSKNSGDGIRIWVPGCASGEEAYSIAILLAEALDEQINNYNIQIFGTDIDVDAIARARKGLYPEAALSDMNQKLRERYFARENSTFQITKTIREMVIFARQDLTRDPPFSHLDLISCRNVLIYFNPTLQQRLIPLFHYILTPGGHLFLGKSESTGPFDNLFSPVSRKAKIYQRRDTARLPDVYFGPARIPILPTGQPKPKSVEKEIRLKDVMHQAVADIYGHPAVIIDDRLEILYVRGDVSPYLILAPGDTNLNILTMARSAIRVDLRALIHKATRERTPAKRQRLKVASNDMTRLVTIHVRPVRQNAGVSGLTLILFEEEVSIETSADETVVEVMELDPRVVELEHELQATRDHLHTTIEELETANEELQSLNEELQSANEELQSSNEELETANEELQSTNEELTTVNEEFQVKSQELAIANADLENILNRIEVGLIIVDQHLKITRFTPSVNCIFDLSISDIGHVLTAIPSHIDLPNLRQDLQDVIIQERSIERGIQTGTSVYEMRITPYYSEHERVAGAVLRFLDLTKSQQTENALQQSEERFRVTLNGSPITVFNQDTDLRYTWVYNPNPAFVPEEILGKLDSDLMSAQDAAELTKIKSQVLKTGSGLREEVSFTVNGQRFFYDLTVEPLRDSKGNIVGITCVTMDITARKHMEDVLRESEEKVLAILESAPEAIVIVNDTGQITLINQKTEEMFGYRRDELLGQPVELLLPKRLHELHTRHRAEYLSDPCTRPMGLGLNLVARHKNGSEFPVEIGLSTAKIKESILIISSITDITARLQPTGGQK